MEGIKTDKIILAVVLFSLVSVGIMPLFSTNAVAAMTIEVPYAPEYINASVSGGIVNLVWSKPSHDGNATITSYLIFKGTTLQNIIQITTIAASDSDYYYYTDSAVSSGNTYYYGVRAVNSEGTGPISDIISVTAGTVPSSPRSLSASRGNNRITLTWTFPENNGGLGISGYNIYRGLSSSNMEWYGSTAGGIYQFIDDNVENYTLYYYYVTASNFLGEGPKSSTVSEQSATVPGSPENVIAFQEITAGVTLTNNVNIYWDAPLSDGGSAVTGYDIYRSSGSGQAVLINSAASTTRTFRDTGLSSSLIHKYEVYAKSVIGTSAPSESVSVSLRTNANPYGNHISSRGHGSWNLGYFYHYSGNNAGHIQYFFEGDGTLMSSSVVDSNSYVYAGTYGGNLFSYHENGTLRWVFNATGSIHASPVIDTDGKIYFATSQGIVYSLFPDGTMNWVSNVSGPVYGSPAIGPGNIFYVASIDGCVHAINATGNITWSSDLLGPIRSTPAVSSDGIIYVTSTNNRLYSLNPSGSLRWSFLSDGSIMASPNLDYDGNIYFGTGNASFYSISRFGAINWIYKTTGGIVSDSSILLKATGYNQETLIYFGTVSGMFYSLDSSGTLRWSYQAGGSIISPSILLTSAINEYALGPLVIFGTSDGLLYNLNGTGIPQWICNLNSPAVSSPFIISSDKLLISLGNNRIYSIGNTPPSSPAGISVVSGNGNATLEWYPPLDNGGMDVSSYRIYRGLSPYNLSFLQSVGADILYFLDNELEDGIIYYYSVSAVNSMGESIMSGSGYAVSVSPPSFPVNVTAESGDGRVFISWQEPLLTGGLDISGYLLYRGSVNSTSLPFISIVSNTTFWFNDTGLENGITYYYYIKAVNSAGESQPSSTVSALPRSLPGAPTNIIAYQFNNNIIVGWQEPDDGGSPIIRYNIYRSNNTLNNFAYLANVSVPILTYTDNNVSSGNNYYYRVTAVSLLGEGRPATSTASSLLYPPGVPSNVDIELVRNFAKISWEAPDPDINNYPVTSYIIYRGTNSESLDILVKVNSTTFSYRDVTTIQGRTYYYNIKAENAMGAGEVSVTVDIEIPVIVSATDESPGFEIMAAVIGLNVAMFISKKSKGRL